MQLEYGKDWTVAAGGRGAPPVQPLDVTGNLVFAGNGYVINKTKVNPYDGIDVKGKIIVVAGLPAEIAAQQAAAAAAGRGGRGGAQPEAELPAAGRGDRADESARRDLHGLPDAAGVRRRRTARWRS